ncbi:hypothetical protein RNZ50_00525 [Paracoccaceae bacterium Fryx2]|nr:hypothetical protein [Paracoccaceae bacterium Fryx2]
MFGLGDGRDRITDFGHRQGDRLHLGADLWDGPLTAAAVVAAFAEVSGDRVVFDFGDGDRLILDGVTTLHQLANFIDII